LAHPQVPATRNEGRVADFLITQLEGIDKTSTFHAAVERLPPAHGVWIDRRAVRRQQYWSLQLSATDTLPRSDDVWSQAVADALERAVARHLTGPAPVGCMLSGGLDSSSIAIVANAQLVAQGRGPLATFSSIDSSDGDCAETSAIRSMLALPGFDPTVIDHAAPGRLLDRLQTLVQEADEPFDALMTLVNAQYCAATDKGVDAVMDGVDGDSLFLEGAGIVRQLRSGHWRAAWKNARGQRRIHGEGAPVLLELGKAARSALVPDALRSRVTALRRHRQVRDNLATSLIAPDFAHRIDLRGRLATIAHHRSLGPRTSAPQEALEALAHPYLTAALERYHRVAAAHGAQPRHPFTDRRLLELCVNLPDRQRFHDGWSKAVLRCAMRDRLPPAVCWRTGKQHLGWALTRALLTHDAGTLTAELRANRKVLDPYVDQARLDAALSALGKPGDDAAAQLVFEALILASWLPRHPG
ncbi:MAG: hypothetical protein JWL98_349, partial [Xanthomonadaceae bacterium]|nr:hypothetical protein [Xanthomonadaceae bacterium]